jgi:hypothetical protein
MGVPKLRKPFAIFDIMILLSENQVMSNDVIPPDSPYWVKLRNRQWIKAAPDLLKAAENTLLVLEGIMPHYDPLGDHTHDGWHCINELKAAIKKFKGVK